MVSKKKRLPKAVNNLKEALDQYNKLRNELNFLTVSKAFEILLEYSWRDLRREVEDQGLEASSPKMAMRQAAKLNIITDPELWLDCLDARNDSVHDYFSISESEYIELAKDLLSLVKKSKFLSSQL